MLFALKKKYALTFLFFFIPFLGALETNSSRIENLEKEIEVLKEDLRSLMVKQARPSANLGLCETKTFSRLNIYVGIKERMEPLLHIVTAHFKQVFP